MFFFENIKDKKVEIILVNLETRIEGLWPAQTSFIGVNRNGLNDLGAMLHSGETFNRDQRRSIIWRRLCYFCRLT